MTQATEVKKKYKVEALGCRTNQYEAQAFRDQLSQMGYEPCKEGDVADLCIVNTCTVTESADSSSRHLIRSLAKQNPDAEVVVTGCLAERDPKLISSLGVVDKVVSNKDKEKLIQDLFPEADVPEFSIKHFDAHTRAFVKAQDGCNSFCTYCIIPYVRGRSRSRTIDEVVNEVKELVKSGYKEVVLTGINIGDFDGGQEGSQHRLHHLVRAVDAVDGLERIRVSSIDPDEIDDELTDAILNGKKTCHSMHIVLQAGSNVILKRMNRKYTRQIFLDTVRRLKNISPDFTVTTDIIVGFPGETEQDFQETLEVISEVEFAKVHMFPYSDRPRTRAYLYPNKVPPDVMKERKSKVLKLAEEVSFHLRQRYVGKRMTILTEEMQSESELFGHTENFLGAIIPKGNLGVNQLVEVEFIKNSAEGLIGRPL